MELVLWAVLMAAALIGGIIALVRGLAVVGVTLLVATLVVAGALLVYG